MKESLVINVIKVSFIVILRDIFFRIFIDVVINYSSLKVLYPHVIKF